jgi:hypothetical protein
VRRRNTRSHSFTTGVSRNVIEKLKARCTIVGSPEFASVPLDEQVALVKAAGEHRAQTVVPASAPGRLRGLSVLVVLFERDKGIFVHDQSDPIEDYLRFSLGVVVICHHDLRPFRDLPARKIERRMPGQIMLKSYFGLRHENLAYFHHKHRTGMFG